jgi:hypothetical protein
MHIEVAVCRSVSDGGWPKSTSTPIRRYFDPLELAVGSTKALVAVFCPMSLVFLTTPSRPP